MKRSTVLQTFSVIAISVLAYSYIGDRTDQYATPVIYSIARAPFSHRIFMPLLGRLMIAVGAPSHIAYAIVIIFSAIGLWLAVLYLIHSFYAAADDQILIAFVVTSL